MFAEERREQILLYLKKHKRAEVKELIEEFQVTGATLRADLRAMEEEGSIVRTHGGALLKEDVLQKEDFLSLRRGHEEEKKAIARIARAYVKEGDAVILDAGACAAVKRCEKHQSYHQRSSDCVGTAGKSVD